MVFHRVTASKATARQSLVERSRGLGVALFNICIFHFLKVWKCFLSARWRDEEEDDGGSRVPLQRMGTVQAKVVFPPVFFCIFPHLSHHRAASFLSEAQHKGVNSNFYPESGCIHPAQLQTSLHILAVLSPTSLKPGWLFSFLGYFFHPAVVEGGEGWTMIEPTNKQTNKELL